MVMLIAMTVASALHIAGPSGQLIASQREITRKLTAATVLYGVALFAVFFSKTYRMALLAGEGVLPAIALLILPLLIPWGLLKLLPPWEEQKV